MICVVEGISPILNFPFSVSSFCESLALFWISCKIKKICLCNHAFDIFINAEIYPGEIGITALILPEFMIRY